MNMTLLLIEIFLASMLLRHALVTLSVCRSVSFLRRSPTVAREDRDSGPYFFIVVPALREANTLSSAVHHLKQMIREHQARIILVTTEREVSEAPKYPGASNTIDIALALARDDRIVHLHYRDPLGVKADQLNFAVEHISKIAPETLDNVFVVVYDADSRPPFSALDDFDRAIRTNPSVDVFHQSSKFELRTGAGAGKATWLNSCAQSLLESGALRANRFVLSYELPRLLARNGARGRFRRFMSSYVYTHVTGHGLCVKARLLVKRPFPSRSPLEDMHYSFILGSHNTAMVPVASLDSAEVPDTLRGQFDQAMSWFQGPARFRNYLKDGAILQGGAR